MREQTTPSGYDQPQTDPIQPLGDEPEDRTPRPDQATGPSGEAPGRQDTMPAYAGEAPDRADTAPGRADDGERADVERADDVERDDMVPGPTGGQPTSGPTGEYADQAPVGTPMPGGADAAGGAHAMPADATPGSDEDTGAVLFGGDEVERFRGRWRELQADFVDDPTQAVQGADELVGEVMRTLTEIFTEHKRELEGQWQGDGPGETEELRVAMRRYRSFFDQLLNA